MMLREVCEGAVGLVGTNSAQAGVELVASIPPGLWTERHGDATRLQQVLVNLLDNAVRFSESGGTVVLRVRPAGSAQISFEVEDHGCGIPEEFVERIFEPFNQVDESDKRRHGGAGLGLSIAREATALMGGKLECVSREGEGTRFFFTLTMTETGPGTYVWPKLAGRRVALQAHNSELQDQLHRVFQAWGATVASDGEKGPFDLVLRTPEFGGAIPKGEVLWLLPSGGVLTRPLSMVALAEQVQERLGEEEESADSVSEPLGTLPHAKIMVVEDNPINRMVLCRMLRTMGLEVVQAVDGVQALEKYSADMDLILMDCQLPKMDGYEATRRLRAQGVGIPILAVTARAQPGDRALCLDAGMDDYLTKPLALPVLVRALRAWLKPKAKLGTA
jgi:CheY-like chemotaxis protein